MLRNNKVLSFAEFVGDCALHSYSHSYLHNRTTHHLLATLLRRPSLCRRPCSRLRYTLGNPLCEKRGGLSVGGGGKRCCSR